MSEISKNDEIANILMKVLSLPPSRAGLRLQSEEDLATLMNVGRRSVRNALSQLEQQGFLSRRRGSGTYVRRVPSPSADLQNSNLAEDIHFAPELFFADSTRQAAQKDIGPRRSQKKMRLELWKDLHCAPTVDQAILDGMIRRANALDHNLTIHPLVCCRNMPLQLNELRSKLSGNHCDGYIVSSRWSDLFMEALEKENSTPIVFYSASNRPITHEPHIMLNTAEAIERGIRFLSSAGYTKIGTIALTADEHLSVIDKLAYNNTMECLGLDYRAFTKTPEEVSYAIKTTQEILSLPDPPDALYIGDNFILGGVLAALQIKGLTPGKDIGIITHSNVEHPLPSGFNWSRIEFDLHAFGTRLINELLLKIQSTEISTSSMTILGTWIPGDTHTASI